MKSDKLEYAVLASVNIQAFTYPIVGVGPNAFCGGPILPDTNLSKLCHMRSGRPVDSYRDKEEYPLKLAGEFIYAGQMYGHFGHFMSEMVHRIIPARLDNINAPFLFVTTSDRNPYPTYVHLPRFIKEILTFLNLSHNTVRLVSANAIVDKLHIYQQGSNLGGGATAEYLDMLKEFSSNRLDEVHGSTFRPKNFMFQDQGFHLRE